jgi:hypothetical protein
MQIPFIIEDTFSEIVLINTEWCLLGITVAVVLLFEAVIETANDPILSTPSAKRINNPFSNERHFKMNAF